MPTYTPSRIDYEIATAPEEAPFVGNCSAHDPETDLKAEQWIRNELNRGNLWAWCVVTVIARFGYFEAEVPLGCCSYGSREDFIEIEYDTLKQEAAALLEEDITLAELSIKAFRELQEAGQIS